MAAKLASYQPYVSANLTAEEAERYECFDMQALWKNFKGPCALETPALPPACLCTGNVWLMRRRWIVCAGCKPKAQQ